MRGAAAGSVLRASARFRGRGLVVLGSGSTLEGVTIDGNRRSTGMRLPIAPSDQAFVNFYPTNGIVSVNAENIVVRRVNIRQVPNFAILISGARNVRIERVSITNSGSLNAAGGNNTTGGILLEEGTSDFVVKNCLLQNVLGNGIWTHSMYTSPRNARGRITRNRFITIGRDAIQVGHATEVRVDNNSGSRIGYPHTVVDMAGGGMPVAIDTAGNVDKTIYEQNRFEEINGKCIDLDGFHHGDVRANTCTNRLAATQYPYGHFGIVFNNTNPDMASEGIRVVDNTIDGTKFGGIFVIGRNHTIERNRLTRLNLAGCNESHLKFGCIYKADEPEILQTGIYLGKAAERPAIAQQNVIADNLISGFRMAKRCIGAAHGVNVGSNTIERNQCRNQ